MGGIKNMDDIRAQWLNEPYNTRVCITRVSGKNSVSLLDNHQSFNEDWSKYLEDWIDNIYQS